MTLKLVRSDADLIVGTPAYDLVLRARKLLFRLGMNRVFAPELRRAFLRLHGWLTEAIVELAAMYGGLPECPLPPGGAPEYHGTFRAVEIRLEGVVIGLQGWLSSADRWGDPKAVVDARSVLSSVEGARREFKEIEAKGLAR